MLPPGCCISHTDRCDLSVADHDDRLEPNVGDHAGTQSCMWTGSKRQQVTIRIHRNTEMVTVCTELKLASLMGQRKLSGDHELIEELSDGPGHGS